MASNRGVVYLGPGKVEVQIHRLSETAEPGGQEDRSWRHPEDRHDQYLWQRSAHGARPHHCAGGFGAGARDYGRSYRERAATSSSSTSATWLPCRSISPAGAAAIAGKGRPASVLTVNPARPGAAYGYVDMGGWVGGQAEYVMVPYADFNLIKFPDKAKAHGEDQ